MAGQRLGNTRRSGNTADELRARLLRRRDRAGMVVAVTRLLRGTFGAPIVHSVSTMEWKARFMADAPNGTWLYVHGADGGDDERSHLASQLLPLLTLRRVELLSQRRFSSSHACITFSYSAMRGSYASAMLPWPSRDLTSLSYQRSVSPRSLSASCLRARTCTSSEPCASLSPAWQAGPSSPNYHRSRGYCAASWRCLGAALG